MTDELIPAGNDEYRARQARYWREQEHLLRVELIHDIADRCAERAERWELEPAWTADATEAAA